MPHSSAKRAGSGRNWIRLALISATAFALIGPELVGAWRILTKPSAAPLAQSAPGGIVAPPTRAPEPAPVKIEGLLNVRFIGASAADYRDLPSWQPGEPTNSVVLIFAVKNESRLFVSYFALNLNLVDSWGQKIGRGVLRGDNIRPGFTVEPRVVFSNVDANRVTRMEVPEHVSVFVQPVEGRELGAIFSARLR